MPLALSEPLSTAYAVFADTGVWGAGDTSERIRSGHVERPPATDPSALPLPQNLRARAWHAYGTAVSAFAECFEELG